MEPFENLGEGFEEIFDQFFKKEKNIIIIEPVKTKSEAIECDKLLTKLVNSESQYDNNLKKDYIVKDYFKNKYNNKDNILIVAKTNENTIIGYAYCKITTSENGPTINHIALLDGLYVDEEYRNQGVATQLITKAQEWSRSIGAKIFEINVATANTNAFELYQKLGFNEVEKKMRLELK